MAQELEVLLAEEERRPAWRGADEGAGSWLQHLVYVVWVAVTRTALCIEFDCRSPSWHAQDIIAGGPRLASRITRRLHTADIPLIFRGVGCHKPFVPNEQSINTLAKPRGVSYAT